MGAARKPVLPVMVVCCVLVGWLVWAAVPALAGRGFSSPTVCGSPSALVAPRGLGVDNSAGLSKGDVYVADSGRDVLDKFTANCELIGEKALPGAGLYQLTVDEYPGLTEGDVYVVGHSSGVVYRFSPGLVLEKEITGLSEPTDVAVDQAGNMFVTEYAGNAGAGKVLEFNAEGEPVNAEDHPDPMNTIIEDVFIPEALAVNSLGTTLYLTTRAGNGVEYPGTVGYRLFGGTYKVSIQFNQQRPPSNGLTLASYGSLFISQRESGETEIAQYDSASGTLLTTLPKGAVSEQVFGMGVNEESRVVYVADYGPHTIYIFEEGSTPEIPETQEAVSEAHGFSATLNGELKPGGAGTAGYYFQYRVGGSCEGGSRTIPGAATEGHVQTEAVNLTPRTQYTVCLVATNKYGITIGAEVSFETPAGPATIDSELASPVGTREATVSAKVNPENTASSYHVEYGTSETFQSAPKETSEVNVGEGSLPVSASVQLTDLEPNTEYAFRFVATNANNETSLGQVASFRTLASGTSALPDDRSYEMVTPPENNNSDVEIPEVSASMSLATHSPFQVAPDGSAITYSALELTGAEGAGGTGNQYFAKRSPGGGWSQSSIQPNGYLGTEYQGFSSDLSVGILSSGDAYESEVLPPLSSDAPGGGYDILYERITDGNGYRTFITNVAKFNRSPARGEGFGSYLVHTGYGAESIAFAGGSADFKDLLFEANDALLPGEGALERELEGDVKGEIQKGEDTNYLYDKIEGRLSLVDVSPEGKVVPNATFGALPLVAGEQGNTRRVLLESNPPDFSKVISADGRFVYWTDVASGMVYVRENGSSTVQVSGGNSPAQYWTASTDGHYALYTEGEGLASELYRFDSEPEPGHPQREALTGAKAGVLGVLGASEDAGTVYFVAEGVLSAANDEGATPAPGKPNLYVISHAGLPVFIATLSGVDGSLVPPFQEDEGAPSFGDWQPGLGQRTAEVTNDGGSIVFMSNQSLSVVGYPHGYPSNGWDEVYMYSAKDGRLFCASCASTGESLPVSNSSAAGFLPIDWHNTYLPQWISEDGNRVFFDSAVPLVAQDTDGNQGVYEWEREGYGSCVHGDGATGGCAFLLSGGSSSAPSAFVGASANGNDAFIVTRAKLVPEDENETFDLYDVRVDGVRPVAPPVCTGTGCQGLPAGPPVFATPSSVTFGGVGNFTASVRESAKPKSLTRAQKLARALKACERQKRRKGRASCRAHVRRIYRAEGKSSRGSQRRKHA